MRSRRMTELGIEGVRKQLVLAQKGFASHLVSLMWGSDSVVHHRSEKQHQCTLPSRPPTPPVVDFPDFASRNRGAAEGERGKQRAWNCVWKGERRFSAPI